MVENKEEEEAKLRQERVSACNREISAVLQKYGCTLDAVVTLRAGQVIPGIQIVPIELMQSMGLSMGPQTIFLRR